MQLLFFIFPYFDKLFVMNIGAEIIAAEIIEQLQDGGFSITLTAVLPYETQAEDWAETDRDRFYEAVRRCTQEKRTSNQYDDTCISRNVEFMLNTADCMIAVWNGSSGNIEYAVRLAEQKGIRVITINPERV